MMDHRMTGCGGCDTGSDNELYLKLVATYIVGYCGYPRTLLKSSSVIHTAFTSSDGDCCSWTVAHCCLLTILRPRRQCVVVPALNMPEFAYQKALILILLGARSRITAVFRVLALLLNDHLTVEEARHRWQNMQCYLQLIYTIRSYSLHVVQIFRSFQQQQYQQHHHQQRTVRKSAKRNW